MLFECNKLNLSNANYGSTNTIIANLIILANKPTLVFIMYQLEYNLTVSCLRCWSNGLTEKKLLVQCTTRRRCTPTKHKKSTLHIIGLQVAYQWHASGGSEAYSGITQVVSLKNCDLFFALLVTHIKYLNHGEIVEILERT